MSIVAFLQNAWRHQARPGQTWPRSSWLVALKNSRSGQRLRVLEEIAGYPSIWYDNTTPYCGAHPSSILPPDNQHIREVLATHKPAFVVALGRQAAAVLKTEVTTPLLVLPHPAYRCLTNELYIAAGTILRRSSAFQGRILLELVQLRDGIRMEVAENV
jgi:hypothetical protein